MTGKINLIKKKLDDIQSKLEKKEEERRIQGQRNQIDLDEEDMPEEEIIDEEELIMLKSMKDLKRDYRENYSTLKGLKQELHNH